MTNLLTTLRQLNEKRTKGLWQHVEPNNHGRNFRLQIGGAIWPVNANDAAFIAASANAMSRLLDVIDAARDVTDLAVNWPKLERLKVAFQALEQADDT